MAGKIKDVTGYKKGLEEIFDKNLYEVKTLQRETSQILHGVNLELQFNQRLLDDLKERMMQQEAKIKVQQKEIREF